MFRVILQNQRNLQYDALKYRRWIKLKEGNVHDMFTIMSFNLLSQHYIWEPVFGHLDPRYLDWKYRFPLINQTIDQFKCDIMCFQEMEYDVFKRFWQKNLQNHKYNSLFVKKTLPTYWGEKSQDYIDGVSIFYNCERFTLLDYQKVNFGSYILENESEFEMTPELRERVVPRNTVALLVKLYDTYFDKTIIITNTHLYWKLNDVKLIQTKILLNILSKFIEKCINPYIIMTGDFNSSIETLVYQLLISNQIILPQELQFKYGRNNALVTRDHRIENPLSLSNIYQSLIDNNQLTFTSFTKAKILDYIFTDKNQFVINEILSQVDHSYYSTVKGFPNQQFPSDHIPLLVKLSYK